MVLELNDPAAQLSFVPSGLVISRPISPPQLSDSRSTYAVTPDGIVNVQDAWDLYALDAIVHKDVDGAGGLVASSM